MKYILIAFLVIHGLIHLLGFAKAFGLAQPPQLQAAISRPMGILWLAAALLLMVSAGDAHGAEMNKSETVTLLNDMFILAPATLIDRNILWEELDPLTVRATWTKFQLGDLTFKVATPHSIYSSALVKVLWDIWKAILTSIPSCPKSSLISQTSSSASE